MREGGFHLLLDLEGCDARLLDSPSAMLGLCSDVARILDARVLISKAHRFRPHGVTAFVVIAESHISVHTWPESGKIFLDVFTCADKIDVERILDHSLGAVRAKRGRVSLIERDSEPRHALRAHYEPALTFDLDFGSPIFKTKSQLQEIELTKGPMGVSLFLDGYWQFVEECEHIYHELLVHPVLTHAPRLHRVGIGGGGDGLAMREVLRYPHLGRAWMYELDPVMLKVAKTHPEMVRLNRRSLEHPKATVVAGDARQMLRPGAGFDALILDFPSISDGPTFSPLYSVKLYERARSALAPDGMLVTQATDFPKHVRRTTRHLRQVFPFVRQLRYSFGASQFGFILASPRRMRQRRPLPAGLRFLTQQRLVRLLGSGRDVSGRTVRRAA